MQARSRVRRPRLQFLGLILRAFQVTPVTIVGEQTLIGRVDGHRVQTGVRSGWIERPRKTFVLRLALEFTAQR